MGLSTALRTRHYGSPGKVKLAEISGDLPFRPQSKAGVKTKFYIHELIAEEFAVACHEAAERSAWRPLRMDCYNPRRIRGGSSWSVHAWAMAVDFFSTPYDVPPPGGVWTPEGHFANPRNYGDATLHPEFEQFMLAFAERGWTWGGRFRRTTAPSGQTRGPAGMDTPHFEWSRPPADLGTTDLMLSWTNLLREGDSGQAVRTLQEKLNRLFVLDPAQYLNPGPIDGDFGPMTDSAVRRFQELYGLDIDGIWGDKSSSKYVEVIDWWTAQGEKAAAEAAAAAALEAAEEPPALPAPADPPALPPAEEVPDAGPVPPGLDEARRALVVLNNYIERNGADD